MSSRIKRISKNRTILILLTSLLTSLVIFTFFNNSSNSQVELEKISGKVALTEAELIELASNINQPIYWLGPAENSTYTLTIAENEQAYIKYLPEGVLPSDSETPLRIIATYLRENAFSVTQTAANNPGAVGLSNSSGAAIYYNSATPSNVYLAFPGQNFQIEIFDPVPGAALELALTPDSLERIGN